MRGIALNIIGGIAAFIGFIVQNFGVVVKHQHHIGNALHQHRGLGRSPLPRRFGDDFSGRQRGNERFFPQDLAGSGNALPYSAGKKRAYLFQIQHFGQLRVQQVQVQLALHFGFQL